MPSINALQNIVKIFMRNFNPFKVPQKVLSMINNVFVVANLDSILVHFEDALQALYAF